MTDDLQLRRDALEIWRAGVDAVRPSRLLPEQVRVEDGRLLIGPESWRLAELRRIVVVGAGKAGADMAQALEHALGDDLLRDKDVRGWVNVPAGCERELQRIKLHPARPAGVNEPTAEGVAGAEQILKLAAECTTDDLCLCLLSGGGSALLPAPAEGVTLEDKQQVTRHLSGAGANIQQLNTVRKQLSRIKGGGLLRACRAGALVTLVISDVIGDPLDVIASGPTIPDSATAADALAVLEEFQCREAGVAEAVFNFLRSKPAAVPEPTCRATYVMLGNNALAVDAAGERAVALGYSPVMHAATSLEGAAEDVGVRLAEMALKLRDQNADCLITGGEPTVQLAPAEQRGLGGRNQQLVLAALEYLLDRDAANLALLSGGTDGEDGPTDAAGAIIDPQILQAAGDQREAIRNALKCNDAYHFFDPLDALIKTGPTGTNVCDIRVAITPRVNR